MAETPTLNSILVRHGLLVRGVSIFVSAALLVLFAAIPLVVNIQKALSQLSAKQKQSSDLSSRVAILTGLDPQVLSDRVKIMDAALPPGKDLLLYLSALDGLSRDLNLNFGGISLSPGTLTPQAGASAARATPGLHTLDTTVKITGSKDNVYSFLRAVEQTLPLMLIKDVKVTVSGPDSFDLTLDLGMLWADSSVGNVNGPITLFTDKEQAYFTTLQSYHQYPALTDVPVATGAAASGARDLFAP